MKPFLIIASALVIAGILLFAVFHSRSTVFSSFPQPAVPNSSTVPFVPPGPPAVNQEMDERMQKLSIGAVTLAASKKLHLDYSVNSLRAVDAALEELHKKYVADQSTPIDNAALIYGAYIGEVIRKTEPDAFWAQDHPIAGKNSFPLHWSAGDSFPCSWARRRITDGSANNVWEKYQFYKSHPTEGKSLAHAEDSPKGSL